MDKMNDLGDLLRHEIQDLYSAEEQMIEAMPAMIEKAKDSKLSQALKEHLRISENQKKRLDEVLKLLGEGEENTGGEEKKGLFSRLFGGGTKCKAMEGLIDEGQKIMGEDMNEEVMDAAIIASAQKIEHYEISGYGTAKAYARQLNLKEVERLLEQTLNEEYEADERLSRLALGDVNIDAERKGGAKSKSSGKSSGKQSNGSKAGSKSSSKSSNKSSGSSKSSSSSRSSSNGKGASGSKSGGKSASKSSGSKENKSSGNKGSKSSTAKSGKSGKR
jgi:ferritin-like metal-binding protein YciE